MGLLATAGLVRLLGRFHPLAIHLPIAFLIVAAGVEAISIIRKRPVAPDLAFACLGLGAAGALIAAPLGWVDAATLPIGPENADLLAVHRWLGTFVAVCSPVAWLLAAGLRRGRFPKLRRLAQAALLGSALAVGLGAHVGGLLVYGRDYYSSAFSAPDGPETPAVSDASDRFQQEILPILQRHCIRCHGPQKQNGRLRLDSREAVFRGGKSGAAIVPGDSAKSRLYRAITDPNPNTRMPQESAPLPAEAVNRIRDWIDQGVRS
ncbi:MAG TPA: c-type cytochrome domain-containing protein [Planctomycetota bacterium]|nr:c-type cytochrome domain-containing protein [Planctomycetota bacterium]